MFLFLYRNIRNKTPPIKEPNKIMERTIWTPHFCSEKDFKVYLDSGFAKEVMQSKIPNEMQKGMNELGNEELKRLGVNWLNPYEFYEDSCFVTQFNIGQNGQNNQLFLDRQLCRVLNRRYDHRF